MQRLIISAPFGNYLHPNNTTATIGTFTLERRPGRLKQVIKTLRYYPSLSAWTNKLGLRNPGIRAAVHVKKLPTKIMSIHGFSREDWLNILEEVKICCQHLWLRPMALELNVSCPNVADEKFDYAEIFKIAREIHPFIIVKIPPVNYQSIVFDANYTGVNVFHCTNTLPMPNGGMSGKPLKRFALDAVSNVRRLISSSVIIGGGGITSKQDIDDYVSAGANHVAIGSGLFNPYRAIFGIHRLADYAAEKCR